MVEKKTEGEYEVKRRYLVSFPITFGWLEEAIVNIQSYCDTPINFNGSCKLKTDYQDHIDIGKLEDWVDYIQQHWTEILESWAWLSNNKYDFSFQCDYEKSTITLAVKSVSIEDCNTILTKLEENLRLAPIAEADTRFSVKMHFFPTLPIIQWFDEFIHYIASSGTPLIYFNASYVLNSYFYGTTVRLETFYGTTVRLETLKEWISQMKQKWSEVIKSNASFSSANHELSFHCDHRRALIDLEVSSQSIKRSNDVLIDVGEQLNLIQVQKDPYRYRKSFATYKVGDWNRKKFVEATKTLIKKNFNEQEPAVSDAFVTKILDNNIERLKGFFDVRSFMNFIEEYGDSTFDRAHLTVEGANGIGIGISLSKKDKRLEFRSNIPPNEIEDKIAKTYKEPLQLKLIKGESTGSAFTSTTQPKTEKWWVKYFFQIIVAVIGAAAVIVTLARAYLTDYELTINNPPTQSPELPAKLNSPEVMLHWSLWPKDSLFHGPDHQASASILVFHQGNLVGDFENITPPYNVQLQKGEGEYIVNVQPERKARPVSIVILYKAQHRDIEGTMP